MDIALILKKLHTFHPNANTEFVQRAYELAEKHHHGQTRGTGEPFIQHPLSVAFLVAKIGMGEETVAAALLHDLVEDTSFSLKTIEEQFGKTVSDMVEGVTKIRKLPHYQRHLQEYEVENLRRFFLSTADDARVVIIRLADRLHNMRTISGKSDKRRREIAMETMHIFAPLANRLCIGEFKGELEDLAFPYVYPDAYRWIKAHLLVAYRTRKHYIEKKIEELRKLLRSKDCQFIDIHGRAKHLYSLYRKLLTHELNIESIYDLIAVRVIVPDELSCYRTLGIIHSEWPPLPGRIKDFIAAPKLNGYQSLHTTVQFSDHNAGEIQIRTPAMHAEAEYGIAAQWLYDRHGKSSSYIESTPRRQLRALFDLAKRRKSTAPAWLDELNRLSVASNSNEFLHTLTTDYLKNRILVAANDGKAHDLPEESTVLDLAYDLGVSYGHHCVGAKINNIFCSPETKLKNIDQVHVLTDENTRPTESWLAIVTTDKARRAITDWLKQNQYDPIAKRGQELLRRELITHKHLPLSSLPKHLFSKALQNLGLDSFNELYLALGRGDITVTQVLRHLDFDPVYAETVSHFNADDIIVQTRLPVNYTIEIAECCRPAVGDVIVGVISADTRLIVHHVSCENLKQFPETLHVAVSWKTETRQLNRFTLELKAAGRTGLLVDIARALANHDSSILELHTFHLEQELIRGVMVVEAESKEAVLGALREIRKFKEILEAQLVNRSS